MPVFGKSGVQTSTFLVLRALATSWSGSHAMASIFLFHEHEIDKMRFDDGSSSGGEPMVKRTFELRIKRERRRGLQESWEYDGFGSYSSHSCDIERPWITIKAT
jgi:hypothetical protein